MDKITLSHGSGGRMMQELVAGVFHEALSNRYLDRMDDAAVFDAPLGRVAMTTDSFVVDPLFFPGGDIGKLAVCGTVNDLASCAAEPLYVTTGFIIEEGLDIAVLKKIVASMAREARRQRVAVVAGDTKVVPRGKADKVFINTTGLGRVRRHCDTRLIRPGDKILINGPVGEHGLSVLLAREKFSFRGRIESDCNSLWGLVKLLLKAELRVRFMRDATRGGVNGVCQEVSGVCGYSLVLREGHIPATASCRTLCDILGLELLDMANEGKMIFFVDPADAVRALRILRSHPLGKRAAVIGDVSGEKKGRVYLETSVSGRKALGPLMTEPVPRIC